MDRDAVVPRTRGRGFGVGALLTFAFLAGCGGAGGTPPFDGSSGGSSGGGGGTAASTAFPEVVSSTAAGFALHASADASALEGTTRLMSWAYYTDPGPLDETRRWYISA